MAHPQRPGKWGVVRARDTMGFQPTAGSCVSVGHIALQLTGEAESSTLLAYFWNLRYSFKLLRVLERHVWKTAVRIRKITWITNLQTKCQKRKMGPCDPATEDILTKHPYPVVQLRGSGPDKRIKREPTVGTSTCLAHILKGKTTQAFFLKLKNKSINPSFFKVFLGKA